MKSGQVTIKDIARELQISPSTVSRALKDHPDISPETKKAVNELAEKLNYQPNTIALSLRQSKTNTIGVIIPEIVHFFFSSVISGIEDIAYEAGYNVIIAQTNESYEREVTTARALFNSRVDGLLVSISKETDDFAHLESLHSRGVPMVFFDRICESLDTSKVIVDDFQGAFDATEHLIQQGCKRIAHLAGPLNLLIGQQRLDGYKKALAKHDIPYEEALVKDSGGTNEEKSRAETNVLLTLDNPPDAIFANNDLAALGALKAVKAKGLSAPEDVAIVGFSNWQFSELTDPPLSTVIQPGVEIGQESAKLLIREIEMKEDEYIAPETKTLKTTLLVRKSSDRSLT
ncbi:MAG: LacI family DNA-binding transcriptional regulator [Bacteroidota bacterium]